MLALLIAAAATSATPTVEVTTRRVDSHGVRASYTRTLEADGTIHLRGHYEGASRTPFHFQVKGDKVVGKVGGIATVFSRPR